jgi:thiol-disulfide isomerase/thioredoxin
MSLGTAQLAFALTLGLAAAASAGELALTFEPVPSPAPETLSGQTIDGSRFDLADHRGQVVLVNFWAGWCPPCIEEMPDLVRLANRMAGRPFVVVAVNAGDGEARVRTLARGLKLDFPVLLDRDNARFLAWGVKVLPTSFLVDGEGRPRLKAQGPVRWEDPESVSAVEGLIAELSKTKAKEGGD